MSTVALDTEILLLRAKLAGKEMERAVLLGDRGAAEGFKVQMYAHLAERMDIADKAGECYFSAAGETI